MSENVGSNVPPETILHWTHELARSKREIDEATARHRAKIKRAKNEGIPTEAVMESIVWSKLEPEERHKRIIDRIRVEAIRHPASGDAIPSLIERLDLRVTERMRYTDTLFDAETKGYQQGKAGVAVDQNPYPAGSEMAVTWTRHWSNGHDALAHLAELDGGQAADTTRRVRGRARVAEEPSPPLPFDDQPTAAPSPVAAKRKGGRPPGSKNRAKRKDFGRKKGPRRMSNVAQLRPSPDAAAE